MPSGEPGPSWNVEGRPDVLSMIWSTTTNSPGWMSGWSDPDAHGPNTTRTPSSRSAQAFARYGTLWGGSVWPSPWRGRNATRRPATSPIVTGADGGPQGVVGVTSPAALR